jgi:hypothetical protein
LSLLLLFDGDDPGVVSSVLKLKHAASSTVIGLCGAERLTLKFPLFFTNSS